jgi:hypothetical protein
MSVVACSDPVALIERPEGLFYELEPSGDPLQPLGILLIWLPVPDPGLEVYNVFGRLDGSSQFDLRGTTSSTSFHDNGFPDLEYRVTAVNASGEESAPSESVLIDERLRLEAPASIFGTTLDGAIHLAWADNAFLNEPDGFKNYRVYSTSYDLDADLCGATWSLEGTTIAPEFLASALANGVSMCFGVSAVSIEGWESLWSGLWADTPRPDARNVLAFAFQADANLSGFRFFEDLNGDGFVGDNELGLIRRGDRLDIDFFVDRDGGGTMFLEPVRTGTRVALYSASPIDDLTSIDLAPVGGYDTVGISAEPGFGYVFEMDGGDGFVRYGGLRVTHVGTDFIIFDWSYQTDHGNPDLSVSGGKVSAGGGLVVTGHR